MKLLVATTNKGKIREIAEILSDLDITIISPADIGLELDVEENGATFAENAAIKARAWSRASSLPALADDSGLCVDALQGRPGVKSARFAGKDARDEENISLLLKELKGEKNRTARFVCAAALALPTGELIMAEGSYEGLITEEPAGSGGFGYDPVFFDPNAGKTFARMSAEEKNARSHRRRALEALKGSLQNLLQSQP
ncbi:MAG TPA: XTP/dITP diphosphatase [Deltaproteobacteria bacterium]|nr:XTP/dITP diphosphatase [Deltaproteobacteria bacterium]HQI00171.1 XTP/dITP diphosphatase [Deltaproteobacteria bacterium]